MVRDIIFYPFAAMLIGLIIWAGLRVDEREVLNSADIIAQGFDVSGDALTRLTASPGTSYEFVAETSRDFAHIRARSHIARADAPPSPGVFAILPERYQQAFGGRNLRVTLTARANGQVPLDQFLMAYFTSAANNSDWQARTLGSEWEDFTLDFQPDASDPNVDYVSIWPGDTAEQRQMDLARIRVEVID